jgi:hypothetical protein
VHPAPTFDDAPVYSSAPVAQLPAQIQAPMPAFEQPVVQQPVYAQPVPVAPQQVYTQPVPQPIVQRPVAPAARPSSQQAAPVARAKPQPAPMSRQVSMSAPTRPAEVAGDRRAAWARAFLPAPAAQQQGEFATLADESPVAVEVWTDRAIARSPDQSIN